MSVRTGCSKSEGTGTYQLPRKDSAAKWHSLSHFFPHMCSSRGNAVILKGFHGCCFQQNEISRIHHSLLPDRGDGIITNSIFTEKMATRTHRGEVTVEGQGGDLNLDMPLSGPFC